MIQLLILSLLTQDLKEAEEHVFQVPRVLDRIAPQTYAAPLSAPRLRLPPALQRLPEVYPVPAILLPSKPSGAERLRQALGFRDTAIWPNVLVHIPGRNELDDLLTRLKIGRAVQPPEQPIVRHVYGYRYTRYRFALDGSLVGVAIPLIDASSTRGVYEIYRGYWKRYPEAIVFFGTGIRVPFVLEGYRIFDWDVLANYTVHTDLANLRPKDDQAIPRASNTLVFQLYADEEAFVNLPAIKAKRFNVALSKLQSAVEKVFAERFGDEVEMVEPIDITMPSQSAEKYRALTR